ncbi:uncharacterized protein RCC_06440 [Ramularia collo-cygni]|uniref:Uncharacterized protein n=1 Tax=Ramularia collo-cygni TaxID=112498 RepID=A0A2D3UT24_9PEZI|nr:uncharacterized protein RCC_06440 [Ramularia collo-cygni]CZT20582.1 uncharacterized protein RCC_06440 [Ramularia collo-cygni]
MAHQRERKPVPEHGRALHEKLKEPAAAPYQTVGSSRAAVPVFVSPTPAAVVGGRKNIRDGVGMIDRAAHGLKSEDLYFFDHGEKDDGDGEQQDSQYAAVVSSAGDSQVADGQPSCTCGPKCPCKPACTYQIHSCPCKPCVPRMKGNNKGPSRSFEGARADSPQYTSVGYTRKKTQRELEKTLPDRGLGDGTVSGQESQRARVPRRNDTKIATTSAEPLQLKRQRAPTINTDLAYVPPAPTKTPSRKQKDTTPLGFYGTHGSHSGQRYPTFTTGPTLSQNGIPTPPVFTATPATAEPVQSGGPIAQTLVQLSSSPPEVQKQAAEPMSRAPLRLSSSGATADGEDDELDRYTPSPLSAPRQRRQQCNKTHAAITGENITGYSNIEEYSRTESSELNEVPEATSCAVTYPAVPRSTSDGMFTAGVFASTVTQSFPSAHAGNPRDPESIADQAGVHREDRYGCENDERATAIECAPMRHSSPASSGRGFPPPLPPPLPLPDFIAPRPATKQRYVSAGGTAKLEDRPEITNFVLPPSVTPGISMQRDLLLQCLDNVPKFATPTRSMTIGSPIPIRNSEEALGDSSTRSSYEDGLDQQGTKRDRKESGSSQRLARFKRVFSFGKEGKDNESKETSPGQQL